jgi:hypothetical protein
LSENEDSSLLAKFVDLDFSISRSKTFIDISAGILPNSAAESRLLLNSCFADLRKSVEFGHLYEIP